MKFDSPEWRQVRDANLNGWLLGNQAAIDFLLALFNAAELWDDLVDGDKPVHKDDLTAVFFGLLVDLTANPFYMANHQILRGAIIIGTNAWLDSVTLEHEPADGWNTVWAYALRDLYMELVPLCAFLVGGLWHMRAVSLSARRFFQKETFAQYHAGGQHDSL